jgi:hypothetical protein
MKKELVHRTNTTTNWTPKLIVITDMIQKCLRNLSALTAECEVLAVNAPGITIYSNFN